MKAVIYISILSITIVINACKSVDKMIEKGQYNDALEFAIKKIAGKKEKETKYVKAIEKAYLELNNRDLKSINALTLKDNGDSWDKISSIYKTMENRQDMISPFYPLASNEGYTAAFSFVNYTNDIHNAIDKAAEKYYLEANELMNLYPKNNNKDLARKAYYKFQKVNDLIPNYNDTYTLATEAKNLGTSYIAIDIESKYSSYYHKILESRLKELNLQKLNSEWIKFAYIENNHSNFDKYIGISIENIDFGPEKERINNYELKKQVEDGLIAKINDLGTIEIDSNGKAIMVTKYSNVVAFVSDVFREKNSQVLVKVMLYDIKNNIPEHTTPICISQLFQTRSISFKGVKAALTEKECQYLDAPLLAFPNNDLIIDLLAKDLHKQIENTISSFKFQTTDFVFCN